MPMARNASIVRSLVRPRSTQLSNGVTQRVRQQVVRRGYASEAPKQVSSEFPWLAGAAAATIGGTFFVLSNAKLSDPLSHPLPGDHYHGEGHHDGEEEEHDGEEGGEKEDEGAEEEPPKEDGEAKEDGSEDEEGSPAPSDKGGKASGKDVIEKPADGKLSKKIKGAQDGDEAADWNQEHVLERDGDSTVIHKPDAKGGAKRRVESAYGVKQGEAQGEDDGSDTAAASKTPVKGSMSGKQAGLSNTDTKHPLDISHMSKKPEGGPDTAKLQGTVDPGRKAH